MPRPTHITLRFVSTMLLFVTWLLALVASVGCEPEFGCLEIGCPYPRVCNEDTGACELPERDCRQTGCATDEYCDEQTLRCRPRSVRRCEDRRCPIGQVCVSRGDEAICEPEGGCDDRACSAPGQICDEALGACRPATCRADDDCELGSFCERRLEGGDRCLPGCRVDTARCPENTLCVPGAPDAELGTCEPPCSENEDCDFGTYCRSGVCRPEPPCGRDEDCRAGEVCLNGKCTRAPCQGDEDCTGEEVCDRSTGLCVGGDCEEDAFAPNHERGRAMTVEENVYARLRSCAGRPDWFALDLAARERLEVELEHESGVDLDLYLYRASDLQLLAVDQRRELQTSVRYLGDRSQRVLLEVRPVRFEDARYDLSVSLEADACREDSYEENDSLDEAATLPLEVDQTTALPLRICGADEDWFRLPALADSGGLRIEAVDAPDGLRLELLGPSGGPALSADPDDGVLAILRLGSGGDYLLRARSLTQRSDRYRLELTPTAPYSCPEAAAHGGPERARPTAAGATHELRLCPLNQSWEIDWLELDAPPPGSERIEITLRPGDELADDIEVALLEELGDGSVQLVRTGVSHEGELRLVAAIAPTQKLFVRVNREGQVVRLLEEPIYEIQYNYE